MTDQPLVSIGIPTFDRPEMLRLALRSAVEQTYEHLDIFIIDDGTNPATEEVVRDVAAGDTRVRYERNEHNLGNYGNGRKVLMQMRGEFQKMLLDDDLLAPTHVEKLLAPMLEDPTISMAFSKRTIIDERGMPLPDPPGMSAIADRSGKFPAKDLIHLCANTTMNWIGEQTTVLVRSSIIDPRLPVKMAGGVASAVMADLTMHFAALTRGDAWYTPEPLSSFRQHSGQFGARDDIHTAALNDWTMIQERLHLLCEVPSTEERLATFGRLIGVFGARLAIDSHGPDSDLAQDNLERCARHVRALREHGKLVDVPRVSIVLTARGEAEQLLPQLEAIIENTPPDAFEVLIATVDPSANVSALLASLEGDVQVIIADGSDDPAAVAADHARHDVVVTLDEAERPARGWIAELMDERLIAETLTPAK